MILDPEAIRFGDLWLWPSAFKPTGRDPVEGKLHAREAKRFFSNSFPLSQALDTASSG
jgi:hypothetical protein